MPVVQRKTLRPTATSGNPPQRAPSGAKSTASSFRTTSASTTGASRLRFSSPTGHSNQPTSIPHKSTELPTSSKTTTLFSRIHLPSTTESDTSIGSTTFTSIRHLSTSSDIQHTVLSSSDLATSSGFVRSSRALSHPPSRPATTVIKTLIPPTTSSSRPSEIPTTRAETASSSLPLTGLPGHVTTPPSFSGTSKQRQSSVTTSRRSLSLSGITSALGLGGVSVSAGGPSNNATLAIGGENGSSAAAGHDHQPSKGSPSFLPTPTKPPVGGPNTHSVLPVSTLPTSSSGNPHTQAGPPVKPVQTHTTPAVHSSSTAFSTRSTVAVSTVSPPEPKVPGQGLSTHISKSPQPEPPEKTQPPPQESIIIQSTRNGTPAVHPQAEQTSTTDIDITPIISAQPTGPSTTTVLAVSTSTSLHHSTTQRAGSVNDLDGGTPTFAASRSKSVTQSTPVASGLVVTAETSSWGTSSEFSTGSAPSHTKTHWPYNVKSGLQNVIIESVAAGVSVLTLITVLATLIICRRKRRRQRVAYQIPSNAIMHGVSYIPVYSGGATLPYQQAVFPNQMYDNRQQPGPNCSEPTVGDTNVHGASGPTIAPAMQQDAARNTIYKDDSYHNNSDDDTMYKTHSKQSSSNTFETVQEELLDRDHKPTRIKSIDSNNTISSNVAIGIAY